MTLDPISIQTLIDGGQSATSVAETLAEFIRGATLSLDVAIYDFALSEHVADPVISAFREARTNGVRCRLAYNVDHARPIAVPPPARSDAAMISACGVEVKAIVGVPDLMHHKYVVRDGETTWTGSTNWTDDSWTREENVILVVQSQPIAAAYTRDFEELWRTASVIGSGEFDSEFVPVSDARVRAAFCPGGGKRLAHRIAAAIGRASRRVRVCSPVITAGPILGTLAETAASGAIDVAGVYDGTQMREVLSQWRADPHAAWKIPCFETMTRRAPFGAKASTPVRAGLGARLHARKGRRRRRHRFRR